MTRSQENPGKKKEGGELRLVDNIKKTLIKSRKIGERVRTNRFGVRITFDCEPNEERTWLRRLTPTSIVSK